MNKLVILLLLITFTAAAYSKERNTDDTGGRSEAGRSSNSGIEFIETTTELGINYVGPSWGLAWGDFNGDTYPDLWVSNHSRPASLYLNEQGASFSDIANDVLPSVLPSSSDDTHGASWADFDNDGDQDVLELDDNGGGNTVNNHLYENLNGINFQDVSVEKALARPKLRGKTPLWFDFDRDGLLDLMLTTEFRPTDSENDFASPTLLQQGPSRFEPANNLAGIHSTTTPTDFASLSDLTGDGIPEVYVRGGSRSPGHLLFDTEDLPFVDLTPSIPNSLNPTDIAFGDFDGDLRVDSIGVMGVSWSEIMRISTYEIRAAVPGSRGRELGLDIKSASDDITFHFERGYLYPNNGISIYVGASAIEVEPRSIFKLKSSDVDNWGLAEYQSGVDKGTYIGFDPASNTWLFRSSNVPFNVGLAIKSSTELVSAMAVGFDGSKTPPVEQLLLNEEGGFVDATASSGIFETSWGVSVATGDFDNDMDLDVYVVGTSRLANRPNTLWENLGDGTFVRLPGTGGAEGTTLGKGDAVAIADYDLDGFLDLAIANGRADYPFDRGPVQLFRNIGNANHWLLVDLEGVVSNRDAVGAKVFATAGEFTQLREQNSGMHFKAQNHTRLHFGLGDNTIIQKLTIQWPSGVVQDIHNIPANQIIRITEPGPAFAPGKPVYIPGQDAGAYLWKETFDGPYHLRFSGDGPLALFDTTILAERPFEVVVPVQLEANDVITHQENTLTLASWVTTWEDGVDFIMPPSTAALIAVEQDKVPNPRQLHVGPSGGPIAPAGFVLKADELPALPAFEGGQDLGLFIGQGGAGSVSARWNGDGFAHRTTLKLISSNSLFDVEPVGLELDDDFTKGPYHLQVSGWISTWWDGVDVRIAPDSTLGIYYEQDGLFQLHRVNPLTREFGLPNAYALPVADVGGRPDYEPASEKGLYLWRDEDGAWHLRVTAGGDFGRYTGAIVASAPYTSVTGVGLEAGDVLDIGDPTQILFDLRVGNQWTDGIDFVFPKGTGITLQLNNNTPTAAELVNIGGERWPVSQLPVRLQHSTP